MENKPVHAHFMIVRHAAPLDQAGLVADGAQRGHEPAVAVSALADVVCRGAIDEELRVVEDIYNSLDGLRTELRLAVGISGRHGGVLPVDTVQHAHGAGGGKWRLQVVFAVLERRVPAVVIAAVVVLDIVQRVQAVPPVELEVNLQVEVRVSVLLVDPAALFDDLGDLVPALCCGVLVGLLGGLGRAEALSRGAFGCALREVILLRNDGSSCDEAVSTCLGQRGRSRDFSGDCVTHC